MVKQIKTLFHFLIKKIDKFFFSNTHKYLNVLIEINKKRKFHHLRNSYIEFIKVFHSDKAITFDVHYLCDKNDNY